VPQRRHLVSEVEEQFRHERGTARTGVREDELVRRGGEYSVDRTEANATEPEDVPAEGGKVRDGTRWVHHIAVQGSGAAGTRDAVRFARALATAADGAVHDQSDGIWANGRTHRPRVRRDAVVDLAAQFPGPLPHPQPPRPRAMADGVGR